MLGIEEISTRFQLTKVQVRERLKALAPLLGDHLKRGKHGRIQLDSDGLAIFQRLLELEGSGLSIQDALAQMEGELSPHSNSDRTEAGPDPAQNEGSLRLELAYLKRTLTEREREIEELRKDKAYLQRQVDTLLHQLQEAHTKLHAMLPPPPPQKKGRRWWRFWG